MVKHRIYIVLFFLTVIYGCKFQGKSENIEKTKMSLSFQIIPEDYERNIYSIEWNDTLGLSEGYMKNKIKWLKRPQEVWCIITNRNNDTLGYYQGLSTAQTFTYFQTTDTTVILNFMIGLNFFTDKHEDVIDKDAYLKVAQDYSKEHNLPIEFEPIEFDMKTELRQDFKIELKQK
jgi:hypothetical protein